MYHYKIHVSTRDTHDTQANQEKRGIWCPKCPDQVGVIFTPPVPRPHQPARLLDYPAVPLPQ